METEGTSRTPERVLAALRRMIRAMELHSRQLAQSFGLTGPQLVVMWQLNGVEQVSVGELAGSTSLSQATITGILDRLSRRGLVQRTRGKADRRLVMVTLTDSGRGLMKTAPPPLRESFLAALASLPEPEQRVIVTSLEKLASMMRPEDADAANAIDAEKKRAMSGAAPSV